MKTKQIYKYLESLLRDRKQQLEYTRSPEAKLFLEGQVMILEQIKKGIKWKYIIYLALQDTWTGYLS